MLLELCKAVFWSSHPVQGVRVERVARLLPVPLTLGLEADLTDGKDVALLLTVAVGDLEETKKDAFLFGSVLLGTVPSTPSLPRGPGREGRNQPGGGGTQGTAEMKAQRESWK